MTTLQAMWAGAILAWMPSILLMIWLFWPRRSQRRPGPWDMWGPDTSKARQRAPARGLFAGCGDRERTLRWACKSMATQGFPTVSWSANL